MVQVSEELCQGSIEDSVLRLVSKYLQLPLFS